MWLQNSFFLIFAICSIQILSIQSNELSKGVTHFAWDLYYECTKASPGNIIISPLSVATSLALLSQAAGGSTFDEIRDGLHLNGSDKTAVANEFNEFDTQLQTNRGESTFSMVNQIYVQDGRKLNAAFQEVATSKFHSGAETLNFGDADKSVEIINRFVEERTNSKIKDFIAANSLSTDIVVILVNAIYFKGNWEKPFNKERTRAADFYVNENNKISTDFMTRTDRFNHAKIDELDASAVELKYANSKFSFVIVMPNKRDGLSELEMTIKGYGLENIVNQMRSRSITLRIPKFKITYGIDLSEALKHLNMKTMYSGNADLNGLLESSSTDGGSLMVSRVVHKAFIAVNEAGSEAGGATRMEIVSRMFHPLFVVDHPFMYFIQDTETGTIIFNGRIETVQSND